MPGLLRDAGLLLPVADPKLATGCCSCALHRMSWMYERASETASASRSRADAGSGTDGCAACSARDSFALLNVAPVNPASSANAAAQTCFFSPLPLLHVTATIRNPPLAPSSFAARRTVFSFSTSDCGADSEPLLSFCLSSSMSMSES